MSAASHLVVPKSLLLSEWNKSTYIKMTSFLGTLWVWDLQEKISWIIILLSDYFYSPQAKFHIFQQKYANFQECSKMLRNAQECSSMCSSRMYDRAFNSTMHKIHRTYTEKRLVLHKRLYIASLVYSNTNGNNLDTKIAFWNM